MHSPHENIIPNDSPSTPMKPYSILSDWLICIVAGIVIFMFASQLDLFEKLLVVMRDLEHLELDEVFTTLIGLNFVFIGLLIRRRWWLKQEIAHSHDTYQRMARERVLLRTVIDYLPDYIFVKDLEGRFILSNVAHARATKATPEELVGKKAEDVFPLDMAAQFVADDEQIMQSNRPLINAERTTIDAAGHKRQVLTTKVPISGDEGKVIGLVGISRDITHRKLEEQQTLELAQERERVKMMYLFTRDAAHDLRTPLTTISTSTYLLSRATDPERREHYTHNIEKAVSRLERLIEGLTYMTQLDSAETLEKQSVNLNRVIQTVVSATSSIARRPDLQVIYDLDATLPDIQAAEQELGLALQNLIDNAVRYTPEGGHLTLRTKRAGDEVIIEVQDTGSGISDHELPRVFDRFFRTDTARSADTGGIGLGLSIAKRAIKLHHGRIEVESVVNQGSTFRIYLPLT
jgi:PAS domain S-box-containing protein